MNQPHNYSDLINAAVIQQNQSAAAELAAMHQLVLDYKAERESMLHPFILAMNEIKSKHPRLRCQTHLSPFHHNGNIICNDVIGFNHPKYNEGKVSVNFDGHRVTLKVTHTSGYQCYTLSNHESPTADALIPEFIHLLAEAIRHLSA